MAIPNASKGSNHRAGQGDPRAPPRWSSLVAEIGTARRQDFSAAWAELKRPGHLARGTVMSQRQKHDAGSSHRGSRTSLSVPVVIASYTAKPGNASLAQLLARGYSNEIADTLPLAWLNPRVQRILKLAAEIAIRYEHEFIGSEHLLLAVIEDGRGPAFQFLKEAGAAEPVARLVQTALESMRGTGAAGQTSVSSQDDADRDTH
jgi:Clp amino terminal domain, pathogenicity island component